MDQRHDKKRILAATVGVKTSYWTIGQKRGPVANVASSGNLHQHASKDTTSLTCQNRWAY